MKRREIDLSSNDTNRSNGIEVVPEIEATNGTNNKNGTDEKSMIPQILSYVDFRPEKDEADESTRFERLETVIERANSAIRAGEVKGSSITIETLYFPANSDWEIDTEETLHVFPGKCVSILRLFYFTGPEAMQEEIAIRDFTPKLLSGGGLFKKPSFENLSGIMSRASDWLAINGEDIDFKNAQCLEIKVKHFKHVDTNTMSHSSDRGDYLRIFRVAYTKKPSTKLKDEGGGGLKPDDESCYSRQSIFLSSVIFTPADQETSLTQIKHKLHDWVDKAIKGNIIN